MITGRSGARADVIAAARAWLDDDPDPDTRAELRALLDAGYAEALRTRFSAPLAFGTAGLRGALGAGPARINRVVVQRAAAGLAAYLRDTRGHGTVVIGYDARHKSGLFARDTAAVLQGAGLDAVLLPRPLPTPVLAYAIRHLRCAAGVMVTASHNPPADNGYKVYLGDGHQIVPPADAEISARIDRVARTSDLPKRSEWSVCGDELVDAYVARAAALPDPSSPRDLRVVYTPLHGVGRDVLLAAFVRAGFSAPQVVAEQAEPDPNFPTVAFPNPEEPGAIDLAVQQAHAADADLVLANDPDADRCAVAVPEPDGFRMLSGDDVGALLATHLLRREYAVDGVFASSIVSSTLLGRIAERHNVPYAETLTGFKWLARVPGLRYAYEEALGYCVDPTAVGDKDGITAGLLICELAATLKAEGRTLLDLRDELAREYGVHATDQLSVRVVRLADREKLLDRLRGHPPRTLAGLAVECVDDLALGAPGVPPTPGLRFWLAEHARVVLRPSGTEPKLKCYLEAVVPVADTDLAAARRTAADRLHAIRRDLAAAGGFDT